MRRRGFTLLETMLVLALAGLLLAAAMPQLSAMLARQQLRTASSDLFAAIELTRSQAIARGTRVLIMPADRAGTNWAQGWIVFVDQNNNQQWDAGEEVIVQHGPVAPSLLIQANLSSSLGALYIAYNDAGRSCSASNSLVARWGTLSLKSGSNVRNIKINMLGRARICDPQLEPQSCTGAYN